MRKTLVICFVALFPQSVLAGFVLHAQNTVSNIQTQSGNFGSQMSDTVIPASHLVEGVTGNLYSRTQINFTQSGSDTQLDFDISHNRSGNPGTASPGSADIAQSQQVAMVFSVDTPTRYELSGYYNVTDTLPSAPQGFPRTTNLSFTLGELSGPTIYDQFSTWAYTPNGHITVGNAGGDTGASYVTGSLVGTLMPGKIYYWSWNTYTAANGAFGGDSGASANGHMSLHTSAVPEPSSMLLLCAGLATLRCFRCRFPTKSVG